MAAKLKKSLLGLLVIAVLVYAGFRVFAPPMVEKALNKNLEYTPLTVSAEAKAFHDSLTLMDWHADTLLWSRDFLDASDYGQVDLARLDKGGFEFQMLTTVTKSPSGQNYVENESDGGDNITTLAIVQGWPIRTWNSLLQRALYQADKLQDVVKRSGGAVRFIKSQKELEEHLAQNDGAMAVLLGAEGAHPLEGNMANIDVMYAAGFRMMGLTHFFDNELGGSLHGIEKGGLTEFGRQAVQRFDELDIIIDLAHASETMAAEVTALSHRPQVVSHTGFKGHCDTPRNFNDELMKDIAAKGGLIAVGMWADAVCDATPTGIAKAIKYGISLVGADHVALGSDWDGSVEAISADAVPQVTQALLDEGVSKSDIAKVMGENSLRFIQTWLPKN